MGSFFRKNKVPKGFSLEASPETRPFGPCLECQHKPIYQSSTFSLQHTAVIAWDEALNFFFQGSIRHAIQHNLGLVWVNADDQTNALHFFFETAQEFNRETEAFVLDLRNESWHGMGWNGAQHSMASKEYGRFRYSHGSNFLQHFDERQLLFWFCQTWPEKATSSHREWLERMIPLILQRFKHHSSPLDAQQLFDQFEWSTLRSTYASLLPENWEERYQSEIDGWIQEGRRFLEASPSWGEGDESSFPWKAVMDKKPLLLVLTSAFGENANATSVLIARSVLAALEALLLDTSSFEKTKQTLKPKAMWFFNHVEFYATPHFPAFLNKASMQGISVLFRTSTFACDVWFPDAQLQTAIEKSGSVLVGTLGKASLKMDEKTSSFVLRKLKQPLVAYPSIAPFLTTPEHVCLMVSEQRFTLIQPPHYPETLKANSASFEAWRPRIWKQEERRIRSEQGILDQLDLAQALTKTSKRL